jgi:hypothetical protein
MRRSTLILVLIVAFGAGFFGYKYIAEYLGSEESEGQPESVVQEDWITLFDGTSFEGWHEYNTDTITSQWALVDGAMVFTPDEAVGGRNSLVTDREFTNFVLELEWKISEAGNSGVFWGVFEDEQFHEPYDTGPEIQVLDDDNHPDGKFPSHRAGSLYDMIVPYAEVVNPVGSWNKMVISVDHKSNSGSVELNGTEVAAFPVNGPEWDAMVANSKFKDWKGFGKYPTGKIGLQDHSDVVAYRNIRIKELPN